VTEVDKDLPIANFPEYYGDIDTSTSCPRQRGTRFTINDGTFVAHVFKQINTGKGSRIKKR
jgi:hypothetical protein